jgi:hypothetical protein
VSGARATPLSAAMQGLNAMKKATNNFPSGHFLILVHSLSLVVKAVGYYKPEGPGFET